MSQPRANIAAWSGALAAGVCGFVGCYYTVEDPAGSAGAAGSGGVVGCSPPCQGDQICTIDGECVLQCGAQTDCGGTCVETDSNAQHCGACNNACPAGQLCDFGQCKSSCDPGKTACGSSCIDVQVDPLHCGGCDSACGADEDCVAGQCVPSCESQLQAPFVDPWGNSWDGSDRAPTGLASAEQTCDALRARLPMATEAFRLRKFQPVELPNIADVSLWTSVPRSASQQWTLNLDGGESLAMDLTSQLAYRCMCPAPDTPGYSGSDCHGPVANECFGIAPASHADARDRAELNKPGALYECTQLGGHLPTIVELGAAIRLGLPNGSSDFLYTANDTNGLEGAAIAWPGTDPSWTPQSGGLVSWGGDGQQPFRCIGPQSDPGVHPNAIPGEFVSRTGRKADGTDRSAAIFADAVDACWDAGGHLAMSSELMAFVIEGLPNGSGAAVASADHRSTTETFSIRWNGTSPRFSLASGITAENKSALRPYRCIYYPIDASYTGPDSGHCQGSCTELVQTGGAKTWIDDQDRPGATVALAIEACAVLGGEVASSRDLIEAFRHGLDASSTALLHTIDSIEISVDGASQNRLIGLRPQSVAANPADGSGFDEAQLGTTRGYRCRWTNEIR